jgi:hypothetical protein
MKEELQNYMGRPMRYQTIDGTGEMAMGVMRHTQPPAPEAE